MPGFQRWPRIANKVQSPFAYLAVTPRSRSENCSGLEQFCSNSSPVSRATPRHANGVAPRIAQSCANPKTFFGSHATPFQSFEFEIFPTPRHSNSNVEWNCSPIPIPVRQTQATPFHATPESSNSPNSCGMALEWRWITILPALDVTALIYLNASLNESPPM